MKYINVCLLAAVACTYSLQASANSLEHNSNLVSENNVYSLPNSSAASHTVTPLELKPILPSNSGVKLAAVCHITDGNCLGSDAGFNSGDNDINLDDKFQCNEEGYNLTSCPSKQTPTDICPFDSDYFKSCKCSDEYKYSQANCNSSYPNSIIGSEQCIDNGVAYSNACVCDTITYPYTSTSCNGNESLSGAICKASNGINYGSGCICTPTSGKCSGYNLDKDTCGGGSSIGESCHDGCNTKWRCKDLCPYKGTLTSCPSNYVCTLEACSSKLYLSGCAVNYINFCTPPVTDCVTLGYNLTTVDCDVNNALKCPYDGMKLSCIPTCKIGSILYSDKSCSKAVRPGKTPIAIVFDTEKKLAVALEQKYLKWGDKIDIQTLTNCVSEPELCRVDGKSNTTIIMAYGKANSISYPAAEYCSNYITEGTIAGNWFLPSFAELKGIYNAKSDINSGLQILGKSVLTESYYWPSIEESANYSSILIMDGGYSGSHYKTNSNYVRPIIAY